MGRKKYSKELKAQIALDAIKGQKNVDKNYQLIYCQHKLISDSHRTGCS